MTGPQRGDASSSGAVAAQAQRISGQAHRLQAYSRKAVTRPVAYARTWRRSTHSSTACSPPPEGPQITARMPVAANNGASVQYGARKRRSGTSRGVTQGVVEPIGELCRRPGVVQPPRVPTDHQPRAGGRSGIVLTQPIEDVFDVGNRLLDPPPRV